MKPYTVVNINKKGEVFDPAHYTVRREDCPELYHFLEVEWPRMKKEMGKDV